MHARTRTYTRTHTFIPLQILCMCFIILVPKTEVHSLRSTAFTSNSISLSWNISHRHKINGPLQEFVITYYRTVGGKINSTKAKTSSTVSLKDFLL